MDLELLECCNNLCQQMIKGFNRVGGGSVAENPQIAFSFNWEHIDKCPNSPEENKLILDSIVFYFDNYYLWIGNIRTSKNNDESRLLLLYSINDHWLVNDRGCWLYDFEPDDEYYLALHKIIRRLDDAY